MIDQIANIVKSVSNHHKFPSKQENLLLEEITQQQ
jgi:hypothetical protein